MSDPKPSNNCETSSMPPHEIELKFSLSLADLARLRADPLWATKKGAAPAQQLISVYYDTADLDLQAKGLTLRVRTIGDRYVQTVKSLDGPGLFGRGEWETELASDAPDRDAALLTPLAKVLDEDAFAGLAPVFLTHVRRLSRMIKHADAEIEGSLDEGEIEAADGRTAPLNELELELKSGAPAALLSLADTLGGEYGPLRLSLVSKAEAGYRLADPKLRAGVKAQAPKLGEARTAADAFQRIGRACLHQLNANEAGVLEDRAREAVHQMRVALRRLRAALSTFRRVAAGDRFEAIKAELKWISGELNDARNLDVLIHETYQPYRESLAQPSDQLGLNLLGEALTAAQTQAYDRVASAVTSARYRRLVLDTAAWMEAGAWLTDASLADTRDRSVEAFAAEALQQRFKSMRKKARDLEDADAEGRHEFRIAAKKMRYTAELLSDLYRESKVAKRRERFVAALKDLQDDLGLLNDMATAEATLMLALQPGDGSAAPPQAGYAAGVMVRRRLVGEPELLKQTLQAAKAFTQATPYW